jgi:hypothetical protein
MSIDRRSITSRTNLLRAREVFNRARAQNSLDKARLIAVCIEQGATDETLARLLGIQLQSVPMTKRRALARVEADQTTKPEGSSELPSSNIITRSDHYE